MEFYNAFRTGNLGDIDSLTRANIKAFNVTTMEGQCYESIADDIAAIKRVKTIQNKKNRKRGYPLGELVYNLKTNEVVYYILDFEGDRVFMVKQLYFLREVGKDAESYLEDEEVRRLIDLINNYEERTTYKKSEITKRVIKVPYDIETGEKVDFRPLILAIINKYMLGGALTIDSWNRKFEGGASAYEDDIKIQCWAERDAHYLRYYTMNFGVRIDTSKSEVKFDYINFGFGSDK